MADTYTVNGVDLASYATRIAVAEGLQDTPNPEQGFVDMPGLDGVFDPFGAPGLMRPPDGVGTVTFDLWLKGLDRTTGLVPGGSTTEREYYRRWDDLVGVFHRRQLTVDHVGPAGTRRAVGRLAAGMSPSRQVSSVWYGRLKAAVMIPGAYWSDLNAVSTGSVSLASGGSLSLAVFADATAPCTDLLVRFGGPVTNPRLTTTYGAYLGWNGTVGAGRMVEFATSTGLITAGAGAGWTPGYMQHDYGPGPLYFEVDPSEALTATFTHAGGGTAAVEVLGRRRYRTSGGGALSSGLGYGVGGYGVQPYGL